MSAIPAGYKQTEVGIIPQDWGATSLRDCCSKITDGTHDTPKPVSAGIPFLTAIHVKDNCIDYESCLYLAEVDHEIIYKRCNPERNDVLMVNIGAGVATTALVVVDYEFSLKNVALLKPLRRRVCGSYLNYALGLRKSSITRDLSSGGAQPFLSLTQIGWILLPLPPTKAEQEAIAESLSDTDALIESQERLLTKKRHLKQAAMQELLTGKKRLPGFSGKWEVKRLGDECELVTKGTTPTSLGKSFTQAGIHFIKVESLDSGGNILQDMIAFIDETTHLLLKRSQLKENDILVSIAGALGRAAIVDKNILPANTNQALAIVRLKRESSIHQKYVFFVLGFEAIKKHIEGISAQGAQANLSLQQVSDFPIFAPPLDEQAAIADTFSDIDAEITDLEAQLDKSRAIKQGMMQKLLTGEIRLI